MIPAFIHRPVVSFLTTTSALLLLSLVAAMPARAQDAPPADSAVNDIPGVIAFIEKIADDTVAVWSDETLSAQARTDAARQVFLDAVDITLLSRAMLGRYYRRATPAQRSAYSAVMTDYIVAAFNERMQQIGFKTLNVVGTTPAPGRRGHVYVKTRVERDAGEPILADWRVRKKDGVFQVVNLEIEGINLVITNREYFAERIKALGGLDGLIEELRAETAASE